MSGIPWWSSGYNSVLSLPGPGSIPGWGTKILQAAQRGWKKKGVMFVTIRPEVPWPGKGSSNGDKGKGALDIRGVRKEERSHQ